MEKTDHKRHKTNDQKSRSSAFFSRGTFSAPLTKKDINSATIDA